MRVIDADALKAYIDMQEGRPFIGCTIGEALKMMVDEQPTIEQAQKTGHWIDKSRGDQKNSECSECHTLFRVLIHDYPYCPVCGSRNRGEEE